MNGIGFRDRALRIGEKSHYYCKKCGADITLDSAQYHKCKTLQVLVPSEK